MLKRDQDTFEEIGLCQRCALHKLEPLAVDLDNALSGDPEGLVMAHDRGRTSYYGALLDIALKLYGAGWRISKPAIARDSHDSGST